MDLTRYIRGPHEITSSQQDVPERPCTLISLVPSISHAARYALPSATEDDVIKTEITWQLLGYNI